MLDISSVYDFDGIDTAKPSIATQANPGQASFYTRPARFVRIEKAVEIPDKTVRKINASAFGPAGMGMREILGYAPVQPDGSVQIQVPANVPFTIDIVDANARRITAQHTSWLQVMPGETKSCNGCHMAGKAMTVARPLGLDAARQSGCTDHGSAVPEHQSHALRQRRGNHGADPGARQLRERQHDSLLANPEQRCDLHRRVDHGHHARRRRDAAFSYTYGGATGIPGSPPTNANCAPWSAQCRITIHYANANSNPPQLYIQNLWNLPSRTATVNGVANTPVTCTFCHNTIDAKNAVQVPSRPARFDRRSIERRSHGRHLLRASAVPS